MPYAMALNWRTTPTGVKRGCLPMFFTWNRIFFNPDTGGNSGSGDPNAGGSNTSGDQPNAGADGGGPKVLFTPEQQAELERILGERVSRAEKVAARKALEAQAKELGFESVDEMKAALEAVREKQDSEKSEVEKLRAALDAERAKAKSAADRAKNALIKAAFAEQAVAANLVNVDDAFLLADLSGVEVDDDGKVTGVKEAVERLVKEKPYLVKQMGNVSGGANPARFRAGEPTPVDVARSIMQRQGLVRPDATQQAQAPRSSFFFGG